MSINVVIRKKGIDKPIIFKTITSPEGFSKYWLPLVNELELKWFPDFYMGIPVSSDNVEEIIAELGQAKEFLLRSEFDDSDIILGSILSGIDNILSALEIIRTDEDTSGWIG